MGDLEDVNAARVIEADGLMITPGFVDIHTHSDLSFIINPRTDSKITQGVTTELVGQCGNSAAPMTDLGKSFEESHYEELGIDATGLRWRIT